jgi:hypothetical protein
VFDKGGKNTRIKKFSILFTIRYKINAYDIAGRPALGAPKGVIKKNIWNVFYTSHGIREIFWTLNLLLLVQKKMFQT